MSGDARDFNNIETRAVIKFFSFLQGKAPKEIHAILTETLEEHTSSYATVKNWVAQLPAIPSPPVFPSRQKNVPTHQILSPPRMDRPYQTRNGKHLPSTAGLESRSSPTSSRLIGSRSKMAHVSRRTSKPDSALNSGY
jgi:hypothetical protein